MSTITAIRIPVEELPSWADRVAVDCDGAICIFEEDAWFDRTHIREGGATVLGQWIPLDDFDGLCFKYMGKLDRTFTDEEAEKLYFHVVRQPGSKAALLRELWSESRGDRC